METPYRRLLGAATATGVFDNIDFDHPRYTHRISHVLLHMRKENEIRAAIYMHTRMMSLLQIMASMPSAHSSMGELSKLESRLHDLIQKLLVGKATKQTPAKLAKQWSEAWNKVFGDQQDPKVKAKIEAAAEAMLRRR